MSKSADKSLRGIQLFVNLPPEEVTALESRCKWNTYPAGGQILERDSDNRDVYFVVSGSVRIVNFSTSGREIALATVDEGSFFGELSAVDGQRRSANVVAVTDCAVASITPAVFSRLLVKHPTVAMHERLHVVDGDEVVDTYEVDLRGW